MPGDPTEELEEVDVTQLLQRMDNVEAEISSQKIKIEALEGRLAALTEELETVGNSVDAVAAVVAKRR